MFPHVFPITCRSSLGHTVCNILFRMYLALRLLKQHDENLFTTLKTSRKLVPTLLQGKSDIFHSAYLTYADIQLEILALHVARNAPLPSKWFFCCFWKTLFLYETQLTPLMLLVITAVRIHKYFTWRIQLKSPIVIFHVLLTNKLFD